MSKLDNICRVEFDAKMLILETKLEALQKLVYISMGMIMALQIVLKFVVFN